MIKKAVNSKTGLSINKSKQAEPLHHTIARKLKNKEPLEGDAPIIHHEAKEGTLPGHDIRTDIMEIAVDAKDALERNELARKEHKPKLDIVKDDDKPETNDNVSGENDSVG